MAKIYINQEYEYRCPITGDKEIETSTVCEFNADEKEQAREEVRELRWKYGKDYWDDYRGKNYLAYKFWMSSKATRSYYDKNR